MANPSAANTAKKNVFEEAESINKNPSVPEMYPTANRVKR
tara:strand:+ start:454 stop:573 length:120 start_codon:yes stop_codon:yes gene_type:complete